MAILTPTDTFDDVYKLETVDPVKAGTVSGPLDAPTDGQTNAPLQSLANRTQYLYNRLLPVGSVNMWAGDSADIPSGWLLCNGAAVSRTTYSDLFGVIGTGWGIGDNSTTFNLPLTNGRAPRGVDGGAGVDPDAASRIAFNSGNSGDDVGTFQDDELESHNHSIPTSAGLIGSLVAEENTNQQVGSNLDTGSTGGNETRMKNFGIFFIIKATP